MVTTFDSNALPKLHHNAPAGHRQAGVDAAVNVTHHVAGCFPLAQNITCNITDAPVSFFRGEASEKRDRRAHPAQRHY